MKKISNFVMTIMLLISSNVSFSQIELVRTFDSQDERDLDCWYAGTNYYELDYGGDMQIYNFSGVNGFITRNIDKENNQLQLSIINNFSSTETQTFQFKSFAGYEIYDVEITQHIFNNDDEFELLVHYELLGGSWDSNEREKLLLFDSKGNILKDFGTARSFYFYNGLFLLNNQAVIVINKKLSDRNAMEIYSVPTTINQNQLKSATISNTTQSVYPNPAKTYVNISYEISGMEDAVMTITDMSGNVIEKRTVSAMQDRIRLNVAKYKPGMYFYEVQGFTGRFIVQ